MLLRDLFHIRAFQIQSSNFKLFFEVDVSERNFFKNACDGVCYQ